MMSRVYNAFVINVGAIGLNPDNDGAEENASRSSDATYSTSIINRLVSNLGPNMFQPEVSSTLLQSYHPNCRRQLEEQSLTR